MCFSTHPVVAVQWLFPKFWTEFDWKLVLFLGFVARLGSGRIRIPALTAFRKFWLPSGNVLLLYANSVKYVPLPIKFWQSFVMGMVLRLGCSLRIHFCTAEIVTFAYLTCTNYWPLSYQSLGSKSVLSVVHANTRDFEYYSHTVSRISNIFNLTARFWQ